MRMTEMFFRFVREHRDIRAMPAALGVVCRTGTFLQIGRDAVWHRNRFRQAGNKRDDAVVLPPQA
jgi:hypothetical protein